jgi:chemotaxis methyl-accepting protein methylase
MDWTGLENRLAQTIGLESSALGSIVFRQSVGRRMRAREAEALPAYMKLLDSDSGEFQALVEELVVRESWFFGIRMHLSPPTRYGDVERQNRTAY